VCDLIFHIFKFFLQLVILTGISKYTILNFFTFRGGVSTVIPLFRFSPHFYSVLGYRLLASFRLPPGLDQFAVSVFICQTFLVVLVGYKSPGAVFIVAQSLPALQVALHDVGCISQPALFGVKCPLFSDHILHIDF
jgi:ABC-type antimicrobial peptide transport system permease subunit